jgi:hypothetical protein
VNVELLDFSIHRDSIPVNLDRLHSVCDRIAAGGLCFGNSERGLSRVGANGRRQIIDTVDSCMFLGIGTPKGEVRPQGCVLLVCTTLGFGTSPALEIDESDGRDIR